MTGIHADNHEIGRIIEFIDELAFETNLLALKVAAEAVPAGEQGRVLAVVAQDLRRVAQRSASAAGEIRDLIEDPADGRSRESRIVDESARALQQIVESVKKISDTVTEISLASDDQAGSSAEVPTTMRHGEAQRATAGRYSGPDRRSSERPWSRTALPGASADEGWEDF
jgi:methyl-accepting chemotaxis protein